MFYRFAYYFQYSLEGRMSVCFVQVICEQSVSPLNYALMKNVKCTTNNRVSFDSKETPTNKGFY